MSLLAWVLMTHTSCGPGLMSVNCSNVIISLDARDTCQFEIGLMSVYFPNVIISLDLMTHQLCARSDVSKCFKSVRILMSGCKRSSSSVMVVRRRLRPYRSLTLVLDLSLRREKTTLVAEG